MDNKKSDTNIVGMSSNIWFQYLDKNNHNTADCNVIDEFNQQKKIKHCFEGKAASRNKSLPFLFEQTKVMISLMRDEKTESRKKSTMEY
jgi:hypothetical protein